MFDSETPALIYAAIEAEKKKAAEKHGKKFASAHEGYAVMLEEMDEAIAEMELVKNAMGYLWTYTKQDAYQTASGEALMVYKRAVALMLETAQLAAMALKFRDTIGEDGKR